MKDSRGFIKTISADRERIFFQCELYSEYPQHNLSLLLYEFQPYENTSDYTGHLPSGIFSFRIEGGIKEAEFSIERYRQGKDSIYSKFKIGIGNSNGSEVVFLDGTCYVTALDKISLHDYDYPKSHTIKGLQVKMPDDAVKLGIGHAALNLSLPTVALPCKNENSIIYNMDGEEFYFNKEYMEEFDRRVKELSDHNIVVTLILLNSAKWDGISIHPDMEKLLLHPGYNREGFISAFNVVDPEGLKYYKAFVEFAAERYTRPDQKYGRACGFIIGNEVDSQWVWCNAGEKTVEDYVREYSVSLRTAFYAARKKYSRARVYISLDHFWTMQFSDNPLRTYTGRDVIDILNRYASQEGNFDWSVAYHPYPQDLFHVDFWNDETAVRSFDTGRITFKNIDILVSYLSQKEYLYDGRQRYIILSEQGFHSEENEESELLQAAAYCLAYKKIESLKGIDSFILHAHVDNRDEFSLNLGLWARDKESAEPNKPGRPKPIYHAFMDIDGPKGREVCDSARKFIGPDIWDSIILSERK